MSVESAGAGFLLTKQNQYRKTPRMRPYLMHMSVGDGGLPARILNSTVVFVVSYFCRRASSNLTLAAQLVYPFYPFLHVVVFVSNLYTRIHFHSIVGVILYF